MKPQQTAILEKPELTDQQLPFKLLPQHVASKMNFDVLNKERNPNPNEL